MGGQPKLNEYEVTIGICAGREICPGSSECVLGSRVCLPCVRGGAAEICPMRRRRRSGGGGRQRARLVQGAASEEVIQEEGAQASAGAERKLQRLR